MVPFVRNLITEWRRLELPFSGETILVCVSGGADSAALLCGINDLVKRKKLEHRFVAAHFNHRLRGHESDADEEFVKRLAAELRVELIVGSGEIPHSGNLEQNARIARYGFFAEMAEKVHAYGVLTAHTLNDQAETFLMNLIRGSGIDGLAAMPAVRQLQEHAMFAETAVADVDTEGPLLPFRTSPLLIRPLLAWAKREDTEHYCSELGIEYRYDTMNEDMAFRRVRIRKMLLPMLRDLNPKIIETLAGTANILRAFGEKAETAVADAVGELKVGDVAAMPKAEALLLIRQWIKVKRGYLRGLELKHIEAVRGLAVSKKSGRMVELPGEDAVFKHDGQLRFERRDDLKSVENQRG